MVELWFFHRLGLSVLRCAISGFCYLQIVVWSSFGSFFAVIGFINMSAVRAVELGAFYLRPPCVVKFNT